MEMTLSLPLKKDRVFQLWHYTVSHGNLLIRSPKGSDSICGNNINNFDLYFTGVMYICSPRFFMGMEISESLDVPDDMNIKAVIEKYPNKTVYKIISMENEYYIIGQICLIEENDLDHMEDKIDMF